MFELAPVVVITLACVAAVRGSRKRGVMTPDRKIVYETALRELKDPDGLRTLAKAFEEAGFKPEGALLRKRAALRELPAETKEARRAVFRRALQSTNADGVENVARAFLSEGASAAASKLFAYATGLRKQPKIDPNEAPPEIEPEPEETEVPAEGSAEKASGTREPNRSDDSGNSPVRSEEEEEAEPEPEPKRVRVQTTGASARE